MLLQSVSQSVSQVYITGNPVQLRLGNPVLPILEAWPLY